MRWEPAATDSGNGLRRKSPDGTGALAWAAVASAVAGFAGCFVAWQSGPVGLDLPWAPTLGLRLDLRLDGLGVLYGLLATGIGAAVFAYGAAYLPWHLEHEGRSAAEARRFWPWMVLFMGSMVDLAVSVVRETGEPADILVRVARERAAVLIFTGTRGRGALSSALLGSVSAGVVAIADRPVGLVPASARDA